MPHPVGLFTRPQAAAGGGGGWTPASLSGLVAWYDASDAGSITESSGSVSQWNDLSGNGNHLTQGTGSNQPTTGVNTINGINVLKFSGNQVLTRSGVTIVDAGGLWTVYVVAKLTTVAAGVTQCIVDQDDSSGTKRIGQLVRASSGGTMQSIAFDSSGNPFTDDPGAAPSNATAFQMVAVRGASSIELYLDGSSNGATSTTGTPANSSSLLSVGRGGDNTGTSWITGDVGEVVVQAGAGSGTDLSNWDTYCARWAL